MFVKTILILLFGNTLISLKAQPPTNPFTDFDLERLHTEFISEMILYQINPDLFFETHLPLSLSSDLTYIKTLHEVYEQLVRNYDNKNYEILNGPLFINFVQENICSFLSLIKLNKQPIYQSFFNKLLWNRISSRMNPIWMGQHTNKNSTKNLYLHFNKNSLFSLRHYTKLNYFGTCTMINQKKISEKQLPFTIEIGPQPQICFHYPHKIKKFKLDLKNIAQIIENKNICNQSTEYAEKNLKTTILRLLPTAYQPTLVFDTNSLITLYEQLNHHDNKCNDNYFFAKIRFNSNNSNLVPIKWNILNQYNNIINSGTNYINITQVGFNHIYITINIANQEKIYYIGTIEKILSNIDKKCLINYFYLYKANHYIAHLFPLKEPIGLLYIDFPN